jgi:hypothetical protein
MAFGSMRDNPRSIFFASKVKRSAFEKRRQAANDPVSVSAGVHIRGNHLPSRTGMRTRHRSSVLFARKPVLMPKGKVRLPIPVTDALPNTNRSAEISPCYQYPLE